MNDRDFDNGCFSGGWTDFETQHTMTKKQKKDLADLLLELEDLKSDFRRISEKKDMLANMMKFYNGGLVTEN